MLLWWKTFAGMPIDNTVVTKGLFFQLMQNSFKSLVLLFVVKWKGLIWTLLVYVYKKKNSLRKPTSTRLKKSISCSVNRHAILSFVPIQLYASFAEPNYSISEFVTILLGYNFGIIFQPALLLFKKYFWKPFGTFLGTF